jgi:hypothetical protein
VSFLKLNIFPKRADDRRQFCPQRLLTLVECEASRPKLRPEIDLIATPEFV